LTEKGCVVSVKDDAAVVAMPMSKECESCGACLVAGEGKEVVLLARNEANAREGDIVEVEIAAGRVVAAAFIIYVIPLILTIVGFVVGNALAHGDPDSRLPIILAVVFLVGSFVGVWMYDMRLRRVERREAVVVRVLSPDESEGDKRISRVKLGG
jgi:sigma-E factor negative regulatory protein RseC